MTDENKKELLSFEEAMEELEALVEKLEEGDVPLEQAIDYFQEGMKLSKLCNDKLKSVESKMDKILNEEGKLDSFAVQEDIKE